MVTRLAVAKVMRKMRLLLIVPAVLAELLMLMICWIIAGISPRVSDQFVKSITAVLPDKSWYFGQHS